MQWLTPGNGNSIPGSAQRWGLVVNDGPVDRQSQTLTEP